MPKYYTTLDGVKHELVGVKTKDMSKVQTLDRKYHDSAMELCKTSHVDVFYCLKKIDGALGQIINAQYFQLPIVRAEVDHIAQAFHEGYWIGIVYREKAGFQWEDYEEPTFHRHIESDAMSGVEFERHCAEILKRHGFSDVKLTPQTGDHGADIVARKNGELYVIQCKCYSSNVGFKAVQEIHTAKSLYHAQRAIVMTNSRFTQQAIEDAKRLGVILYEKVRI